MPTDGRLSHRVVPFEDRMPDAVPSGRRLRDQGRGHDGGRAVGLGVPAILVPLPGAPRDHQTRNALALVEIGAAVHLPDPECDGRPPGPELEALLADPERLGAMRRAARAHARPDAADRVAELVDAHAR